jgi:hypothetical protein
MANPRRHRLELPAAPKTDDPATIQKYLNDIRRLTMDEFNRLSGDYFDFKTDVINSATIPLASVAAISVTPDRFSATFTWENPAQTQGDPTHVRVRIAEFGDTWAEYAYPLLSWTAYGLSPSTSYTFQIQLLRRESGTVSFVSALRNCPSLPVQVQSTSEIRSRTFTTLAGIGVPTDDGGDSIIPIPDVDGTPGPPGGANCWWQWQIQVVDLTTGQWSDTTYSGTVAGNAGQIDFDVTVLDALRVYRIKYREVCNGVPGPWQYGEPFTGGADWAGTCGGNTPSDSYADTYHADADLFVLPYACLLEGQGLFNREYLSGILVVPGEGYDLIFRDTDQEWTWTTRDWTTLDSKLVGSTYLPAIEGLDNNDDFSLEMELRFFEVSFPSSAPGGFYTIPLLNIGEGRLLVNLTYNSSNQWGVQFVAARESGGVITLNSPLTYSAGTFDRFLIDVSISQSGDKMLFINGDEVATDTLGQEVRLDGMSGLVQFSAYSQMWLSKLYGWSRALAREEIPLTGGILYNYLQDLSGLIMFLPLRETSGTVADDLSSVHNDGTYAGTPALASVAGSDGFNYAALDAFDEVTLPDSPGYSTGATGGITIIALIHAGSTASGANGRLTKGGEWAFLMQDDGGVISIDTFTSVGGLAGRTFNVTATGVVPNAWNLVIIRLGTGAFGSMRVNGANRNAGTTGSGTNVTSGTGNFYITGTPGATAQGVGLVAMVNYEMTDVECQALEAIAVSEGWY